MIFLYKSAIYDITKLFWKKILILENNFFKYISAIHNIIPFSENLLRENSIKNIIYEYTALFENNKKNFRDRKILRKFKFQ